MPADDFTRNQFRWLDQIACDPSITAAGFVLAYWISKHINRKSGDAWPAQDLLAAETRMTVRGVRGLSNQLEAAGHLQVIASHGPGYSCRYWPILQGEDDPPKDDPAAAAQPHADEHDLFGEREAAKPPRPANADFEGDFDAWWLQYPRKVSKGSALKSYQRARKSGATADELELGAMRYAAERSTENPKFTKHPATWLNNRCWLDAPEQTQSTMPPGRRFQGEAPMSHLEIALAGLRRDE